MNTFIGKSGCRFGAIVAASIVAALASFHGIDSAGADEAMPAVEQSASIGADGPLFTTGSLPAKSAVASETTERFIVHRSAVRTDSVAISVVTLDSQEERTIAVPGVVGVSFNKVCRGADGARIACGSRARIQLVNFVTRKEMTCTMAATVGEAPKPVACAIDGQDVAEWIVRSGIGRPTVDGLHLAAMREARNSERGMWADAETRNGLVLAAQR
jgi:endonuclease YncB( thermonuclease family)